MSTDPMHAVLSDLLRAAADDCDVRLSPLLERRLVHRMTELAELGGIELARTVPAVQRRGPHPSSAWHRP